MSALHDHSAREQLELLRGRHVSPLELVDHYLDRINRLDGELGAFITVTADAARDRARALAEAGPTDAPLWGIPLADKDLSERAGVRTTFGSAAFADYISQDSDDLVRALDDAHAVSLGKSNTPEFGMPAYTESDVAPPASNPYRLSLGAGGSSGGAATAVAAGLLPFAPGSDGGGSVRIPAAATGLVGIKPSRGRVPSGTALGSLGGLPVPGPLARTVADAALLLDAMVAGGEHPYAVRAPEQTGTLLDAADRPDGTLRLAVLTESPWQTDYEIAISAEAQDALDVGLRELGALGHSIDEMRLPEHATFAQSFRTVWQSGALGIPLDEGDVDRLRPLTRWLLSEGRRLTAADLAGALRELSEFERRVIETFAPFDAIVTPTLALTPRPHGWFGEDPEDDFARQCQFTPFTSFVNVAGLPAITLPVHETPDGLPMGIQLIGRPGDEATLVRIGAQLERVLEWHHRHPPVWNA